MEAYVDTIFPESVSEHSTIDRAEQAPAAVQDRGLTYSRWATILSFIVPDVLVTGTLLFFSYGLLSPYGLFSASFELIMPLFGVIGIAFACSGLYTAVSMHPAHELRLVAIVTTIVFVAYLVSLELAGMGGARIWIDMSALWFLSLVFFVGARALGRVLFSRREWWGAPTVILASNGAGDAVVDTLERWPELGLRPVALLHNEIDDQAIDSRLTLEMTRLAPMLATTHKIPYAVVAMPDLDRRQTVDLLGRCSKFFRRVLVVPELPGVSALWTSSQTSQGLLGYGVQHVARSKKALILKRTFDIIGSLVAMVVFAPLWFTIAVLIKLDSPGPVFYRQIRMTRGGRCFRLLKFRSMHVDADERLHDILNNDALLKREYERFHKLRQDPRVTRVGKLLRRYSLDELPQFWNVLFGDLSLVGPRAYMPSELSKMDGYDRVISQSRPGLTGLWQVSGRNDLSFEERIKMDVHYIHNWTLWLDLYLLARTAPVVMTGEGAA